MTSVDVVIPSYNRQVLLRRTLESVLAAPLPSAMQRRVIVVDNASTDGTAELVSEYVTRSERALSYVFEPRSGRSYALNAGIAAGSGELIAMIDDDEEVDSNYFFVLERAFADDLDYVGGPMLPRWGAPMPEWLPLDRPGVIGWIDAGKEARPYSEDFPGILVGGNCVLTRRIVERVGGYATHLGRNRSRLMAGEDEEMYKRLLAADARGRYLPDLIVYHYVPPERLQPKYYRNWSFWRGVSGGMIDRDQREPVPYFAGLPRYRVGAAIRALPGALAGACGVARDPRRSMADLMEVLDLAGFAFGRFLHRPERSVSEGRNEGNGGHGYA